MTPLPVPVFPPIVTGRDLEILRESVKAKLREREIGE